MREQRQRLARRLAGVLVFGTLVVGAAAPADAAVGTSATSSTTSHHVRPCDTGWNGT